MDRATEARLVAFEELRRSFYPAVYRLAYRLTGNGEEARDIVQETFLRLYQNPGEEPDNPRAWIFRVAANLGRDHLRRSAAHRRILAICRPDPVQREAADNSLMKAEEIRLVRLARQRLRKRDQLLLSLYQEGLSYAEIAAAARIPVASVGTVLARALARMGKELRALGLHPAGSGDSDPLPRLAAPPEQNGKE